jgi:hypothetical protein
VLVLTVLHHHWCYSRGAADCWALTGQLVSEAAQDNFDLQFVTLTGPDHVGHECDDIWFHGIAIIVGTGDLGRTTFHIETETGVRTLVRYNAWRMEPLKSKFIQRLGASGGLEWLEQKLLMLFPHE